MIVVSDSSSLIALASVGQLNLLHGLFGEVLVPGRVWDEVVQENRPGMGPIAGAAWIRTVAVPEDSYLLALKRDVDPGEAEAMALAAEAQADIVLLDERRARKLAISLGFQVVGAVGVLLRAKREGFLPQLRPVMDQMIAAGFRIGDALYGDALRDAGEL